MCAVRERTSFVQGPTQMHAETTWTLDIDDLGGASDDVYCEFCGDEHAEPHVYNVKEDAINGMEDYVLVCCRQCLLAYVKREHPWAFFQVSVR